MSICDTCKHLLEAKTCKAFPEGIPLTIVKGSMQHSHKWPGQRGEFVYEPSKK